MTVHITGGHFVATPDRPAIEVTEGERVVIKNCHIIQDRPGAAVSFKMVPESD